MQAVRAHNASFVWSTRFKSAGGRDIGPSLFEEKRALFVFVATGSGVGVRLYVSGVLILCFTVLDHSGASQLAPRRAGTSGWEQKSEGTKNLKESNQGRNILTAPPTFTMDVLLV